MAILVTGGAGYIGSVCVELLRKQGTPVVVLDNLFRGHRAAVDPGTPFYEGNSGDRRLLRQIAKEHPLEACIHFAALAYVGESVTEPARYFDNNFCQAAALFETLVGVGVKHVVFSSTCATYGDAREVPIPESHPQWPVNPYGWSKFYVERLLESFDHAYGLKFVALRYFNAAGATEERGEEHEPESHLIPNVLRAAQGVLPHVSVFGTDYPTRDGTAVRDYIHVHDLCTAHLKALDYLKDGGASRFLNLGTGHGFSVFEVIEMARRVTGLPVPVQNGPRRAGDPPQLIAQAAEAQKTLNWQPARSDLETIVRTAWEWHRTHPQGYGDRKSGTSGRRRTTRRMG